MIICYSRCMVCGRQTPHEVCHRHTFRMPKNHWAAWKRGFNKEPEICDDPNCKTRILEVGPAHPQWATLGLE